MTSAIAIDLKDLKGKKTGSVELAGEVFAIEPNMGLVHTALVRQLANARRGNASTKTRSEVSGGGRKPWRQKGTGRARAGSIRSPLWAGGGVTFGPKPRDYSKSMPKKMRVLALKSALAAQKENIVVVQDFDNFKEAKTKQFCQVLKDLGLCEKKVLVVLDYACEACERVALAARNIADLKVIRLSNLNVKDLLHHDAILTNARTLEAINKRFTATHKEEGEAKAPKREKASKAGAAEKPAKAAKEAKAPAEKAAKSAPKEAKAKAEKAPAAKKDGEAKKTTKSTKKDA